MLQAALKSHQLRSELKAFRPDVVYMRQMLWFPGLIGAIKDFCVVQEVNSDIESELRLLPGLSGAIKLGLYKLTRAAVDGVMSGGVFVTHELAEKFVSSGRFGRVISNGYIFESYSPPFRERSWSRPRLIFVGSPGQPWHGVDKVKRMAELLPEFDFHLVVPGLIIKGLSNLVCHGRMVGQQLVDLYRNVDVSIGSLALHRNNMDEACPLKCREYAANGLPIVAGYRDTDLSGSSFYLELNNCESNVEDSIDKIRSFVINSIDRSFPYSEAIERLDAIKKERERLNFFNEVILGKA